MTRRTTTGRDSATTHRARRSLLTVVLIVACLVVIVGALSGHLGSGLFGSRANGPQAISPSTMATGACVALPPTSGDNHRTIFLDAGHGGVDPGGVGTTESGQQVDESTVNLAIELDTSDLLRAQGYRVVVSRTADTTVVRLTPADLSDGVLSATGVHADVAARDICANFAKADALVGIYMDSSTSSADAGSVTVYDTARPFAAANQRPAQIVQTDVLSAMNSRGWQIPDDGAFPDAGYGSSVGGDSGSTLADLAASYNHLLLIGPPLAGYFSTPSLMPGAVIEPLYLTDPFEGSIAATPGDQQVIAKGIAAAVEQFLAPVQSTPTS